PPDPPPRRVFRDFLRRRKTQIVGAGMLGLVAGALLGGITVSAFTDHRDVRLVPDQRSLLPPHAPRCHVIDDRAVCFEPVLPPAPTWTG
ncbi:hypothetical protein, partial [Nonomuraea aridisoli]